MRPPRSRCQAHGPSRRPRPWPTYRRASRSAGESAATRRGRSKRQQVGRSAVMQHDVLIQQRLALVAGTIRRRRRRRVETTAVAEAWWPTAHQRTPPHRGGLRLTAHRTRGRGIGAHREAEPRMLEDVPTEVEARKREASSPSRPTSRRGSSSARRRSTASRSRHSTGAPRSRRADGSRPRTTPTRCPSRRQTCGVRRVDRAGEP